MKKILPLTYEPNSAGVLDGSIRQTIRKGWKYKVGDQIAFHGWEGAPYRSKWNFRTEYFTFKEVIPIMVHTDEIWFLHNEDVTIYRDYSALDELARLDGIDPPTGEALRDVLMSMGCTGKAQILRW